MNVINPPTASISLRFLRCGSNVSLNSSFKQRARTATKTSSQRYVSI